MPIIKINNLPKSTIPFLTKKLFFGDKTHITVQDIIDIIGRPQTPYEYAVEVGGFVGTPQQWLDSLKGAAGATGAAGPQGPSLYDLAVEQGFSGTVQEFLDSLKGEDGRSIEFAGSISSQAEMDALALTLTEDDAGKGYYRTDQGLLYIWSGTEFGDDGIAIQGPAGPPGSTTWAGITDKPTFAPVATTGLYNSLTGLPVLGTASALDASSFATATQGAKADSALQPNGNGSSLTGITISQISNLSANLALKADYANVYNKGEVNQLVTDVNPGVRNYLKGSLLTDASQFRTDVPHLWTVSNVNDARFGPVVQVQRISNIGGFQKSWPVADLVEPQTLTGTDLVYFVIAKDVYLGTFNFSGNGQTGTTLLSSSGANKIDLGDGWMVYWAKIKLFNLPTTSINISDVRGIVQFHAAGIQKGNRYTDFRLTDEERFQFKTINGEVITGTGNIVIQPDTGTVTWENVSNKPIFGTAAAQNITAFATSAQGAKADSALQPTGNGSQLTGITQSQISGLSTALATKANTSSLGTAAFQNSNSFASAAQGQKADTALQSSGNGSNLLVSLGGQPLENLSEVLTTLRGNQGFYLTYDDAANVALTGSYNDLINRPGLQEIINEDNVVNDGSIAFTGFSSSSAISPDFVNFLNNTASISSLLSSESLHLVDQTELLNTQLRAGNISFSYTDLPIKNTIVIDPDLAGTVAGDYIHTLQNKSGVLAQLSDIPTLKTVNGQSLIGSGNIVIDGGGGAVDWSNVTGKPTFGTAALQNSTAFATSAQGTKADSALQPAGNGSQLVGITQAQISGLGTAAVQNATAFATAAQGTKADTALQSTSDISNTRASDFDGSKTIATILLEFDESIGTISSSVGSLATVASTGSYNDLSSKPTIPAAQQQSDWNASSGITSIANKPTDLISENLLDDALDTPKEIFVDMEQRLVGGEPETMEIDHNGTDIEVAVVRIKESVLNDSWEDWMKSRDGWEEGNPNIMFVGTLEWVPVPNGGGETLSTPTLSLGTPTDDSIPFTITAVDDATSYYLQYDTENTFATPSIGYSGSSLTGSITGLEPETTYYVRVRAQATGFTNSAWSTTQNATTDEDVPLQLSTPTLSLGTVTSSSVPVTISSVTDATSYTVQYSTASNFASPTTGYTGNSLTPTISGLSASTLYYFRVKATASGFTDSNWSTTQSTTTSGASDPNLRSGFTFRDTYPQTAFGPEPRNAVDHIVDLTANGSAGAILPNLAFPPDTQSELLFHIEGSNAPTVSIENNNGESTSGDLYVMWVEGSNIQYFTGGATHSPGALGSTDVIGFERTAANVINLIKYDISGTKTIIHSGTTINNPTTRWFPKFFDLQGATIKYLQYKGMVVVDNSGTPI